MEHPPNGCQECGQGMLQVTFFRVPIHELELALGREDEKRAHEVEDALNFFKKSRLTKALCPSRVVNGYGELNSVQ